MLDMEATTPTPMDGWLAGRQLSQQDLDEAQLVLHHGNGAGIHEAKAAALPTLLRLLPCDPHTQTFQEGGVTGHLHVEVKHSMHVAVVLQQ